MVEEKTQGIHLTYCFLAVCVAILVGCSAYLGGGFKYFPLVAWAQGLLFFGLSLSGFLLMAWGLTQERNRLIFSGLAKEQQEQSLLDFHLRQPWRPSMPAVVEERAVTPDSLPRTDSSDSIFSDTSDNMHDC